MENSMTGQLWARADNARSEVACMSAGRNINEAPVPLRLVREGEWVTIVALRGGRGFHDRLGGMGLHIGGRLEVIHNRMDGKVLLGHEGARLFLGGGMAQKIHVVIDERRNK